MRVIAGTHRRRTLLGPVGKDVTRPITDRAKQSLFDRLTNKGAFEGRSGGGVALDVFSGTGSLGIEAMSRGSAFGVFVERDRVAVERLRQNLDTLGLTERATVLRVDALSMGWLGKLGGREVGVLFCDPPYSMSCDERLRGRLTRMLSGATESATAKSVLVLRTGSREQPLVVGDWGEPETYIFGSMGVHIYGPGLGEGPGEGPGEVPGEVPGGAGSGITGIDRPDVAG